MNDYKKAVEYYASNRIDYLFHNEGPDHAKTIFEVIFRNAKSYIRIAARNLWNNQVVNTAEYLNALSYYLNQENSKLDILIKDLPDIKELTESNENNIFRFLYCHPAYSEGRITIHSGDGKCFKTSSDSEVHFCTADGHIYRYEYDIDNRKAEGNFNDIKKTQKLDALFIDAFKDSREISLETIFGKNGTSFAI